ncbi:hypothetical protein Acsp07_16380 [Actinomycetospora sp. NBRC 106378]|nr:hypothetical protein Acsp07_16380 [Actinomycetospora sp. NBRC 106378]
MPTTAAPDGAGAGAAAAATPAVVTAQTSTVAPASTVLENRSARIPIAPRRPPVRPVRGAAEVCS